MKVLIVKMTSMGDVLHTLAAVTDAARALPGQRFDWLVEEPLAQIPAWHPAVDKIIPVAIRRWRNNWWQSLRSDEFRAFKQSLREQDYDLVIDAQGLFKSAWMTRLARGRRVGLSWGSAREPIASLAYERRIRIPRDEHAVLRTRRLFAAALGYAMPDSPPDFGLDRAKLAAPDEAPYIVGLHATTWPSKHYPEHHWAELVQLVANAGFRVLLPSGTNAEAARAARLAAGYERAEALPRGDLGQIAVVLAGARGVISVDTGLSHLAAALAVPQVSIYGSTDPARTGTVGPGQRHLAASLDCAPCLARECRLLNFQVQTPPCYEAHAPAKIWAQLQATMAEMSPPRASTT